MWCTVTPQLGSPGQWELTQRLLYLSPSSSTCVQGTPITVHKDGCNWVSHGFLFLTLLPTASPSPPCPSRKGGAGMLWPRIRARVLRFPPSSPGANSLGVMGSARDLWCPCSIFGVDSGRLIPLPFTGICPISPDHPQLS